MDRPRLPPLVVALNVILIFLAAAQYPYYRSDGVRVVAVALIVLNVVARWGGRRFFARLNAAIGSREALKNSLLLVATLIVTLGALETIGQVLVRSGAVGTHQAMKTMIPRGAGNADFRMRHITFDRFRIPDPVLLWRPVDRRPYTSQRLKGPVAEIPKPAGTFRIMCYGDSNTDGPNDRGWPEVLARRLAARMGDSGVEFEVLNAGVAGYSSYQGLMRFRSQVARFQPDLVTVSFGWNDVTAAIGRPDNEFQLPPRWLVGAQRQLLRYSFYRVAEKIARQWAPEPPPSTGPRVPLADYLANLEGFLATGRRHGAEVVLLTRPHSLPAAKLARIRNHWRGQVPLYNRSLVELGRRLEAPVVDVQGFFERNHPEEFSDNCHFTLAGHEKMAEMLIEAFVDSGLLPLDPPTRS